MKIVGRHILTLFRPKKRWLVRFVATSIGRTALTMASVLLIREFLAGILGEGDGLAASFADSFGAATAVWVVAALLVSSHIGASLMKYDNQVLQQRMVKVLELGLMQRLVHHLLALSVSYYDRHSEGDLIQLLRQDVARLRGAVLALGNVFLEATLAVGLFVAAVLLSPRLTFWALVVVPAAVFPIRRLARRTLLHSFGVRRKVHALFDLLLQILGGIRVIKAYRGEATETRNITDRASTYFDELIDMAKARALSQVVLESLASLGVVAVIIVGGFQVMDGTLTWPSLLAFLMAVRALQGSLNNVNTNYIEIQRHRAAVQRIVDLFNERSEVRDASDPAPLPKGPATIAVEGAGFTYDGGAPVLDGISFVACAGDTIGIAGPSGAGKSTLLNLLARFYDPTSGTVRFDGRDLREYRSADVYDRLALVTQDPFLFATTVRENIRFGRPDASDSEVEDAARAADIHDDILAMPQGYDMVVGAGGRSLSRGEGQRINVARAVLKNPPILLLDETTSSLDSISAAKVQKAIDRISRGRTTFMVAHRLASIRHATRIVVLEQGRAVGIGSHDELLETCPLYRGMWEAQRTHEPLPIPGPAEWVAPVPSREG